MVVSRKNTQAIGKCNTSFESSHCGDFSFKYPDCLFCFFWINVPLSFCLTFQCNYTLTLLVPCAPLFSWTLHNHNLPADWVRELFKPSNDAGSLVVHIYLTIGKVKEFSFFCGWRHNGGRFMHFGRGHWALGVKPMTQFFDSLKTSL